MEKLKQYQSKRDFTKTQEPQGGKIKKEKGDLQFVIQLHAASSLHYDVRLEWNKVMLSWAVPKGPSYNPTDKRLAMKVEDHPLEYNQFEGTIPQGQYGGGTVMIWDRGTFIPRNDFKKGLKEGSLKFTFNGKRLFGDWTLVRIDEKKDAWLLIKEKDQYAKKTSGIRGFNKSIISNKTLNQIAKTKKKPYPKIEVELAKLAEQIPQEYNYLYEIKYDGYRIIALIQDNEVKLLSRNGNDYTKKFPSIVDALMVHFKNTELVLDGEMIVTDDKGRSDFQLLQKYLKKELSLQPTFVIFDLPFEGGKDLRKRPLFERKRRLKSLLDKAPKTLVYSLDVENEGEKLFKLAKEHNLEGIIAKVKDSPYLGKRSGNWLKIKNRLEQEFIVGGFIFEQEELKSLLLGVYQKEQLVYVGKVGTGWNQSGGQKLIDKMLKLKRSTCPFKDKIDKPRTGEVVFIKPQLIAQIAFAEWTNQNLLRQASFLGLRDDKKVKEVINEEKIEDKVVIEGVEISNPKRVVYEDLNITKEEVARYYQEVSLKMLPLIKNRLISATKCYQGVENECFIKKHPQSAASGIKKHKVKSIDADKPYFSIESVTGLINEVQQGTIEFHIWGSQVARINKPDWMVFDLDPDDGVSLKMIRKAVKDLKKILDNCHLKSFLKTSGGKGYHIIVPFEPVVNWKKFKDFAHNIVLYFVEQDSKSYTASLAKTKRKGKIFIDYLRNGKGATSVAPYSLRARKGAKVSMPISYAELDKIAPDGVDLKLALKRLRKGDPWKDIFKVKQFLK